MSFFEQVKTSDKLRDRVSGVWLLLCIIAGFLWLQYGTDFDVANPDWWVYLIDVIRIEHRTPTPYAWVVPGILVLYFAGTLFGKLTFKRTDYGDARKARAKDLVKMELDGRDNIVIGHFNEKPIIPRHNRHALVVAGTRSGKRPKASASRPCRPTGAPSSSSTRKESCGRRRRAIAHGSRIASGLNGPRKTRRATTRSRSRSFPSQMHKSSCA